LAGAAVRGGVRVRGLLLAREYLRVSVDRSGRQRSPEEQHGENVREAEQFGFELGEQYRDNDRSASRYARKTREDFEALMADLEADRFGAEVLLLWESSRGSRQVSEWVLLIELCEKRGVLIHVTTHHRTYDPANRRDRRSLLEDSVDSEYESAKISERAKRAARAGAAAGMPTGPVQYGFKRLYDPETRRLVAQVPHPAEAKVVRELFKRIAAGHSMRSIAIDFEQRGIRTRTGKVFTQQHLRSLALKRAYAGERVHNPEGGQGEQGPQGERVEQVVKAVWKPLVSKATFLKVQDILSDPKRRTVRPGRGVHLLTGPGMAGCAVCGGNLAVRSFKGEEGQKYVCHRKACARVSKTDLDRYAEAQILAYVSRKDVHDMLAARADKSDELDAIRDEIAEINAELDDLADQVGRGELSSRLAGRAEPAILARLKAAREREADLATPSALRDLLGPAEDVAIRWEGMPMSAKRRAIRLLFDPAFLGRLCLTRTPKRGRAAVPIEQRVSWNRQPQQSK
jgi:site-specific DNA recombinase